jgi:acyl-coenzyme A synthetase/AMP-(fatty) acid ligase
MSDKHFLIDFPIVPGVQITDFESEQPHLYAYDEIDQRINAVASGLLRLNLPTNSRIVIIGYSSYNFITTNVGIYRARHALVPINHKMPKELVEFCIRDSDAKLVFYNSEFKHLVPADIACIEFGTKEFDNFLSYTDYTIPVFNDDHIISVVYTSGTTGKPKGVLTSYGARLWQLHRGITEIQTRHESIIFLHSSPLYHLAGLNNMEFDLFFSEHKNIHAIIMPYFNAREYIKKIQEYRCTHVRLISPMMSMILNEQDLLEQSDLTSVQYVALTSSFAPLKLQNDILQYFTNVTTIVNPYGSTESGSIFTQHHPLGIPKPKTSAGYPADYVKVRLDEHGVLQIKSPTMLSNYNNRDNVYKKSITDDGYYITGDIFTVNKYGFYFYQGRADDMFKSGGEKIYPSEIESIIERHPSVAISTVVGVPDDIKGHKPYAFVQLKPGSNVTANEIKEFVINNVATYQIPRLVWIFDELPKTSIGKIDRMYLTHKAQELLNNV